MRDDQSLERWVAHFSEHLSFERDRKKLLPFAQCFFSEPEKLYAFLCFLMTDRSAALLTAEAIIASHLFHRFTQFANPLGDDLIQTLFLLLEKTDNAEIKTLFDKINNAVFPIDRYGKLRYGNEWKVEYETEIVIKMVNGLPTEIQQSKIDRTNYAMSKPQFPNNQNEILNLYRCFNIDLMRFLDFENLDHLSLFSTIVALMQAEHAGDFISELTSFILNELSGPFALKAIETIVTTSKASFESQQALIQQNPLCLYLFSPLIMWTYDDDQTPMDIDWFGKQFDVLVEARKNPTFTDIVLWVCFYENLLQDRFFVTDNAKLLREKIADQFFNALIAIASAGVRPSMRMAEDEQSGIPSDLLARISSLTCIEKCAKNKLKALNEPVYHAIKVGASFEVITALWQRTGIHVLKHFCHNARLRTEDLPSVNALKVMTLITRFDHQLIKGFSDCLDEMQSFSLQDKEEILAEKRRTLLETYVAADSESLRVAIMDTMVSQDIPEWYWHAIHSQEGLLAAAIAKQDQFFLARLFERVEMPRVFAEALKRGVFSVVQYLCHHYCNALTTTAVLVAVEQVLPKDHLSCLQQLVRVLIFVDDPQSIDARRALVSALVESLPCRAVTPGFFQMTLLESYYLGLQQDARMWLQHPDCCRSVKTGFCCDTVSVATQRAAQWAAEHSLPELSATSTCLLQGFGVQ